MAVIATKIIILTNFPSKSPNLNSNTGAFSAYTSILSVGLNSGIEFGVSPVGQNGTTPAWQ